MVRDKTAFFERIANLPDLVFEGARFGASLEELHQRAISSERPG